VSISAWPFNFNQVSQQFQAPAAPFDHRLPWNPKLTGDCPADPRPARVRIRGARIDRTDQPRRDHPRARGLACRDSRTGYQPVRGNDPDRYPNHLPVPLGGVSLRFATPIQNRASGEWHIWWITARKYRSGRDKTPIGQWVSGAAVQGGLIAERNI